MSTIDAVKRDIVGSSRSRRLRKDGFVPAVLFGLGIDQEIISVCKKSLLAVLKESSAMSKLLSLSIDGSNVPVLMKDIQFHPVTSSPLHVDFMRVSDSTVVEILVPLKFINEDKSPGMKHSGILNVVKRKIKVSTLASNIPSFIEVDMTGTGPNTSITTDALQFPEGVSLKMKSGFNAKITVATIISKRQKEGA